MTVALVNLLDQVCEGVQALRPYEPGKPVEELERELGIQGAIKLASNENPLGPSEKVLSVLQDNLKELSRYPDGNGFYLKQKLAAFHDVDTAGITLGNGSNDILEFIARAWLRPGREAVFFDYSFAVYPIVTQAVGANAVVVPVENWQQPLGKMRAAITDNTSVIFIANPNNPTGVWISTEQLKAFIASVPKHILIVIDEAYFEYVQESDYSSMLPLVSQHENLVVTRTYSKAYGLAGLRIGYGISHADVADRLNRVRQPFNVNLLALAAAEAALDDQAYIKQSVDLNTAGMKLLTQSFQQRNLEFIPSVGNFISFNVGADQDAMRVYQSLLRQGVIVRPMAAYRMASHLRVTIGTEAENKRFLAALAGAID